MPGPDAHLAHQDGEAALIRQLLDQQSAIQARLAGLLSARRLEQARLQRQQQQQHGFDLPRELGMLRHKIGVLEAVADHHGALSSSFARCRFLCTTILNSVICLLWHACLLCLTFPEVLVS